MKLSRRAFQKLAVAGSYALPGLCKGGAPVYAPTLESLRQYACPEWFRDAKFGIWAHWGPQSAPERGDWYARGMYIPKGQPGARGQYETHVARYGPPSEFGYKDVIRTWKAEKFTPDYARFLLDLYREAGARYFVTTVHHHDNVDLWDSKTHRWNSVAMGPKKDITAMFRTAARAAGLRFGIASHLSGSESWFAPAHNYDGADPAYADLYHPADQSRYDWPAKWYARVSEIVTRENPDILWFDHKQVPYGKYGMRVMADYYNARPDGVCALKQRPGKYDVSQLAVKDYEYGVPFDPKPYPWISDSVIGHWFWNSDFEEGDIPHVSSCFLIRYLIDAVSKNGGVQLVVPQRSDGTVHEKILSSRRKTGRWLAVNGEGIYATRPFRVYGEGPGIFRDTDRVRAAAARRGYDYSKFDAGINYGPWHRRYTQSKDGKTVYAFLLGRPQTRTVLFQALEKRDRIRRVELLGSAASIPWKTGSEGLEVTLPEETPFEEALCLRIGLG